MHISGEIVEMHLLPETPQHPRVSIVRLLIPVSSCSQSDADESRGGGASPSSPKGMHK